jgi:outer membrane protein assembly factor BamB
MTRRVRRSLLLAALVLILGIGGTVAYLRWATILNWFESEREDKAAVEKLQSADLSTPSPSDAAGGWFQWRGPNRDGVAPPGPLRTDWEKNPPKELWSVPLGGGYSSPVVVGGRVYVSEYANGNERILAYDAAKGIPFWSYAEPADYSGMTLGYKTGPRATPTIQGNRLYAVGATGRFVCLALPAAGGEPKLVWGHDLVAEFDAKLPTWGIASSPLIEGDLVIVQPGGRKGSVVAFDKTTGDLRWAAGKDPCGYSSPVAATLGGVRQSVAVTGKSVVGIRPADGTVLWTYSWVTQFDGNIATPIVAGDYVFVSASYAKGCALLRVTGDSVSEVYFRKNRVMRNHHDTCVVRDGFLYGFDDAFLRCVNLRTGQPVEDWEALRIDKGHLILADKYLVGLTESGKLFLVDADSKGFNRRGLIDTGFTGKENWATPVLVDGRLYVRGSDGLKCYDVK